MNKIKLNSIPKEIKNIATKNIFGWNNGLYFIEDVYEGYNRRLALTINILTKKRSLIFIKPKIGLFNYINRFNDALGVLPELKENN